MRSVRALLSLNSAQALPVPVVAWACWRRAAPIVESLRVSAQEPSQTGAANARALVYSLVRIYVN
jgi:hypothetical protein